MGNDTVPGSQNILMTATGNTAAILTAGLGGVGIGITGTWTGTVTFEGTYDGTNWFSINAFSAITGIPTTTATANGNWRVSSAGYSSVRVRSSTIGTGTAAVYLRASGAMPLEPVVNAIVTKPTNVQTVLSTATAGVAGVTTEALMTLVPTRAAVAGSTSTTFSPTAGKTFRIQNISVTVVASTAAIQSARFYLRGVPSGTATATSPILGIFGTNTIAAVIGAQNTVTAALDLDIPSGWSIGLTQIAALASGTLHVTIQGYEY